MKRNKIIVIILAALLLAETIVLLVLLSRKPKRIPRLPFAAKGEIAIVLDDWGYNLNNLNLAEEIKYPLTMSILPNLPYSQATAQELQKRGFEIILHLPMEPHEKYRLERNTILISMGSKAILGILKQDLSSIAYLKGVSNHMGSKATEDAQTMSIIFQELKQRNLYYLDSVVSSHSICADMAAKFHLAFAKRDVFLDNQQEREYILRQIYKLKTKARLSGRAVGIGHDRRLTLEVLKEAMPQLEKEGYRFVFVSELVK